MTSPLSTKELQAIIDKVREESTRAGYTDGAYDMAMAIFRAINVPAPHISRPSLWATPIGRGRDLREYTDCNGIEALDEIKQIMKTVNGEYQVLSVDEVFEAALAGDDSPVEMPQSSLDTEALEAKDRA